MKLYPAVFGVMFIADKKYRPLAISVVLTLFLTAISAMSYKGGITASYAGLMHNLNEFSGYITSYEGFRYNSSLFFPMIFSFSDFAEPELIRQLYPYIAMTVFLLIFAYIVCFENELWKRVSLLTFMILLLPQISFDYKLINLFIPLVLFVDTKTVSRFSTLYAVIFGLLLIPKDYIVIFFYVEKPGFDFMEKIAVNSNGMANCALMIGFSSIIILERWLSTRKPKHYNEDHI
jgi:hypothetical protein